METKHNPIEICELKFSDDDWKVTGYASVFNSVDMVGDTIIPGAFQKSLESGNEVRMHMEHLRWITPGRWDAAHEDDKGLYIEGHLTRDHSVAKDLRASMRHGTVRGLSIGYVIPPKGSKDKKGGGRDISAIDLVEVSFTATPAEPKATIESFKSELDSIQDIREFESFLREVGNFSKSMANATIGKFKTLVQSESVTERAKVMQELKSIMDQYDLRHLINRGGS